jgi:ATP-binding cassette, subfamily B, multidrug efflux pump
VALLSRASADPAHGADKDAAVPSAKRSNRALIVRYWRYARDDRAWLAVGLVGVPLMSLAGLAQPWLLKEAIDGPISAALNHADKPTDHLSLAAISLIFLVAVVGEYVLRGTQLYALQRLGYRSLERLRQAIYEGVVGQGLGFFDRRSTGSLLSRSTNDVEALGEVLAFGMVGIIGDIIDIIAIAAAMLWLDVRLTLVSLVVAPFVVLLVNRFRAGLRYWSVEIRVANAASAGFFSEAVAGRAIVQQHGREQQTMREYKTLNHRYLRAYHRANWYDASLYAIMDGVSGLAVAALIWYGAGQNLRGAVSLGLLVAFIQYIQRLFVPVRELSGKFATIERAFASLDRIFDLLDVDERLPEGDHAPETVRGELELRDLTFAYRQGDAPVLQEIALRVRPGEVVAIVGPTGSGKSTIGKLLCRLYAAPAGSVVLDGVAVELWQREALRAAIGVVAQDVVTFSGTMRANVTLGREDVDDAAVERALHDARLTERVARMGGLGAYVAEHGANLSAGERQLLSIARVLVRDPPIVVLDEATANVDPVTERDVTAAIERVLEGRTVLVVAHRLSTIRRADRIVFLDRGRIVEQGSHDELIAAKGAYARLVDAAVRDDAGGETLLSHGGATAQIVT